MPAVNWDVFTQLPGAVESNFEKLCRSIVRRHYGQFGEFKQLANQAGVEFHLKLRASCDLGKPPRWFGWQCKWYQSTSGQRLGTTRRKKITEALGKTRKHLPDLTDWILWTRYPLTKLDQTWFYELTSRYPEFNLALQTADDIEALLAGSAALLRETYFGELVITQSMLAEQFQVAASPFRHRYQPEVHHVMRAEETLAQYLGGQAAWNVLPRLVSDLNTESTNIAVSMANVPSSLHAKLDTLTNHGKAAASVLNELFVALGVGDLDTIQQLLRIDFASPHQHRRLLSQLRAARTECALSATNLAADIHAASLELAELRRSVGQQLVAVVAPAGTGKSELAVQMTCPSAQFPAGVLLFGKELQAGQNLDHLVGSFKIAGKPVQSFERLVEALDAAGQREGKRLLLAIDGLNEAEDPRNWKFALYRAGELLTRFPYVLLVVTLRNEFAGDCLPDNIETLELEGFEDAPEIAIKRYFEYYKIDATDADLPLELLQHPLTLRIYCEVANAERRHVVGVEALPRSLTELFDEHFRKVAERVADLSPSLRRIYQEEVQDALLKIAELLWREDSRSVESKKARTYIDGTTEWARSILKALESEGIIVRTSEPNGKFGVAFAYDLMAGHVIARFLLLQGDMEPWLKEPTNLSKLTPRETGAHTLAYDIFRAMVGLFPVTQRRRQLWQTLPSPLAMRALLLTARMDPAHINRETVEQFEQEMLRSTAFAKAAFPLLRITRAAHAHPFDANFLDRVLRGMSNAERDLSWTEWLRSREDDAITDVKALESRWTATALDRREISRARYVGWILTTTSRYLRDLSTKALYKLALGLPEDYFHLAIESLTISDPYVPERTVAAAYGAALSTWSDKRNQKMRNALPKVAADLVHTSFLPSARAPSRHALLRQYSLGIIELARRIDPSCIPVEQLGYLAPPFDHLPNPFVHPPRAGNEQIEKADKGAISMDFGNYTIGGLIPDRSNYDYDNADYIAVRNAIVDRMIDLGYDPDKFQSIDQNLRSYTRGGQERHKTDRYGKKYGWIAYFEMWGWRSDNNLLPDWRGERPSDADIDPTFPDKAVSWTPPLPDLFTKARDDIVHWIPDGPVPDYSSLLQSSLVGNVKGRWTLLNGFIEETAKADYRQIFTFLRGIIIDKTKVAWLLEVFNKMEYPGNYAIPQEPQYHYTYAGEMIFEILPGLPIKPQRETSEEGPRVSKRPWSGGGVPVEIPVHEYSWESHHSELNAAGGVFLPSPKLAQHLSLGYRPGQWDLYDDFGVASLSRRLGTDNNCLNGRLVYLREDLLHRYLDETSQALVWLIWGERGLHYRGNYDNRDDLCRLYADHKHIHKVSTVWHKTPTLSKKLPRRTKSPPKEQTKRR